MKFSNRETKDLIYAGLLISLAFAFLLSGGYSVFLNFNSGFLILFVIAFFTAGLGFLLHELMHKYVAQGYGLFAEFKAFYGMIWLAVLFSLFGFIIAAPGAVFISGLITKEKNGKISWAGPMTNIVLALIFIIPLMAISFLNIQVNEILYSLLNFGLSINALLALFNMIPAMPFDGAKIIAWNKTVYGFTVAVALGLFIVS